MLFSLVEICMKHGISIGTLMFTITTFASIIFLSYTGDLYFKTFLVAHKTEISVYNALIENNNTLKITLLIKNTSPLSFKITYVKEEIYRDKNFNVKIGEHHKSAYSGFSLITVFPFSNVTLTSKVRLESAPTSSDIFIKVYMRFDDVPIVKSLYITRFFKCTVGGT